METDLYRHYDDKNNLLYVGISISAVARLSQHKRKACWYKRIARVEIARFPTREEAEAAEKSAIESERPAFNLTYAVDSDDMGMRFYRGEWMVENYRLKQGVVITTDHAISLGYSQSKMRKYFNAAVDAGIKAHDLPPLPEAPFWERA